MRRRALGLAAFAAAAAGGAVLGYLGERRLVEVGRPDEDPERAELASPPPVTHSTVVSFDGTELHVVTAGPEGAPPIVLCHGYVMSWRFWHYQVRDLADEFRVVAYDQRGHGDSDPAASGDYTTAALARDLRAVLDAAVGERPAVVAGHSLGGMTVMAFADEFGGLVAERLAGAALLNTASSKVVYRGMLQGLSAAVGALQRLPRRALQGRLLPGRLGATDLAHLLTKHWSMAGEASPAVVAFVEEIAASCPVDVMAGFGRVLATLDLRVALDRLVIPALVVVGERDWITPARQGRDLAAGLADSRLVALEGVGHMVPLEAPQACTTLLREHARRCFPSEATGAA